MTNVTHQIAAEKLRERIPTALLLFFEELTNEELAWRAENGDSFAGWELEYREAAGIEVYYDAEADLMKRRRTR